MRALRFIVCLSLFSASGLVFAAPALTRIQPPAAQQGTEVEVQISGSELEEPQEVFFEKGKITVKSVTADKSSAMKAVLVVPADCPVGPHRMRVRTAEGLSELRMFHVHASEQVAEKEPNNTMDVAQPMKPGTAVWGSLGNEDVDIFSVHLPAGGKISAVVRGATLDQTMLDPFLEIVDANGFTVAECDDHPLLSQDAVVSLSVEKEGDYFLRLRESTYRGGGALYLLHAGEFPVPHVAWPPGGQAGKEFSVDWIGDPAGPFSGKVTLPAAELDGLSRVRPVRDGKVSALAVPFRVTNAPIVAVQEPAGSHGEAVKAKAPVALYGRMDASGDLDYIRVEAPKGSKWKVSGWGRRLGSPVDLVVNAYRDDEKRTRITGNDDSGGPDSLVQLTVPEEGAFVLRVNEFQQRGGPDFIYWLDVEPMAPSVTVSVPPKQTKTQQRLVVAVPRGNRMAIYMNASRNDCNDPIALEFGDLPAGVKAMVAPLTPPAPGGVIVFEASDDAPFGTSMASIAAKRGDGESSDVVGGMRQGTDMIFGNPNRTPYRTSIGDRLAVAVVEPAPVSIEVLQPPTPIARRGVMELKVKINRVEGFNGNVRLELPFKPPGIGASTVEVKGDQSEAVVPLSASSNAEVKDWQITVAATVRAGSGDKKDLSAIAKRSARGSWIASRPVTLSVVEPLVELAAEKASVEQGQEAKIIFKATKPVGFEGTAKVRLMGLPVKTEAPELDLAAGKESIEFPIKVAADAPAGKHNVFCRIEVPKGDSMMIHQTPATSLRIDKPLPPEDTKEEGT